MAEARAMVHIIRAEARAHQLLEQVGLFVGPFGGAETGERTLAIRIPDLTKSLGRGFERFFPGGLAEDLPPVVGIDNEILALGDAGLADQGLGEAMPVLNVIEAVSP